MASPTRTHPLASYPLFLKLEGRPCLVIGGSAVAARKIEPLLRAGAAVTVLAERLDGEIEDWARQGRLRHLAPPFSARLAREFALIVVAEAEDWLAARVSRVAHDAGILVNVVDRPALSNFILGATIDRAPVQIAISSGGGAPVLARQLRSAVERLLPQRLGALARFAERFRSAVRSAIPEPAARRRFWERVLDGPVAAAVLAGDEPRAHAAMMGLINRPGTAARQLGIVHLVGAGPGDPELLTLRAARLLAEADAVVYDGLLDPAILERARRDAERHFVGKRKGVHSRSQGEINALLARLAGAGKRVVRLKGGDPFIFGRGGEELEFLRARSIPVEVVPGISAALGCAAAAQIPLTLRGVASSVTLVSGHAAAGMPGPDWAALARMGGTVALYMAGSVLGELSRSLTAHGMRPDTPAAVIENGTRPEERVLVGTLGDLERMGTAERLAGPTLILIGEALSSVRSRQALAAVNA